MNFRVPHPSHLLGIGGVVDLVFVFDLVFDLALNFETLKLGNLETRPLYSGSASSFPGTFLAVGSATRVG